MNCFFITCSNKNKMPNISNNTHEPSKIIHFNFADRICNLLDEYLTTQNNKSSLILEQENSNEKINKKQNLKRKQSSTSKNKSKHEQEEINISETQIEIYLPYEFKDLVFSELSSYNISPDEFHSVLKLAPQKSKNSLRNTHFQINKFNFNINIISHNFTQNTTNNNKNNTTTNSTSLKKPQGKGSDEENKHLITDVNPQDSEKTGITKSTMVKEPSSSFNEINLFIDMVNAQINKNNKILNESKFETNKEFQGYPSVNPIKALELSGEKQTKIKALLFHLKKEAKEKQINDGNKPGNKNLNSIVLVTQEELNNILSEVTGYIQESTFYGFDEGSISLLHITNTKEVSVEFLNFH